jgi:hypothetical protein
VNEETAFTRLNRVPKPLADELRAVAAEHDLSLQRVVELLLTPRATPEAIALGQRRLQSLGTVAETGSGVRLPRELHLRLRDLAAATRVPRGDAPTVILAGCVGRVRHLVGEALAAPATTASG